MQEKKEQEGQRSCPDCDEQFLESELDPQSDQRQGCMVNTLKNSETKVVAKKRRV